MKHKTNLTGALPNNVFYFSFIINVFKNTQDCWVLLTVREKTLALRICTEVASYCADISVKQHSRASCDCWRRNSTGKSKHRRTFLATTKRCHSKHSTIIVYIPATALGIPKSSCTIKYYITFLYYKVGRHQVKMCRTWPDFTSLLPLTRAQTRTWSEADFVRPSTHVPVFSQPVLWFQHI